MGRNPEPPDDLITHIKKLERRIENLERSQRIGNTSIDDGNVIVNNGAIIAKHPNGEELFRTGTGEGILPFEVDPSPGYVTRITRASGVTVFQVFSSEDGTESNSTLNDREGNEIVGDDYLVGRGLSRPYIPWRVYKVSEWTTPPEIVTSSTFVGVYLIEANQQHPAVYVNLRVVADAGTAGEVRLQDTFFNTTLWTGTITSGLNGNVEGTGTIPELRSYGENASFEIQARRTAGAGNIRMILAMAYGRSATSL